MPLDGITIHCLINELKAIKGSKIDKIYQPFNDTILITFRNLSKKMLISVNPVNPRLYMTEQSYENPITAPSFCMSLRKYIVSGRIVDISQEGYDRIIYLNIDTSNEMHDRVSLTLTVELMGRHSNILLMDKDKKILAAIKTVSENMSKRPIMPGLNYTLPPTGIKTDPDKATPQLFNAMDKNNINKEIVNNISGMSPLISNEIVFRAQSDTSEDRGYDYYKAFKDIVDNIDKCLSPCILTEKSTQKLVDFSFTKILHKSAICDFIGFNKINDMLSYYYKIHIKDAILKQMSSDLEKIINARLAKLTNRLNVYNDTLKEAENRDIFKLYGEILTSNMYMLKRGMKSVDLVNYYDGSMLSIPLDPTLTPSMNAQKYYKKYNKLKNALKIVGKQKKELTAEINYLESILSNIKRAAEKADLYDIRSELIGEGYIKKRRTAKKNESHYKSKPRHYIFEGFDIFVGRNNIQNDVLTMKTAKPQDMWLHTNKIHGSHVIIKSNGSDLSDAVLLKAAQLAAYYSDAQNSSKVPVDFTIKKNVRKPPEAKPGMVTYDNYKTLIVEPSIDDLSEI